MFMLRSGVTTNSDESTLEGDWGLGMPRVLRHQTAQAAVGELLRELILSGEIAPGARLLQAEVARRFSISTTPVREALRQLTAEGLLDSDPHRGVTVHVPTLTELEEIYETRLCIETMSITRSVETLDEQDLDRAEELLDAMEAEPDLARWIPLNLEFHRLLTDLSRSRLAQIIENLRNLSAMYIAASVSQESEREIADREHRVLLEAYRARDVKKAQAAIQTHLESTLEIARHHVPDLVVPATEASD